MKIARAGIGRDWDRVSDLVKKPAVVAESIEVVRRRRSELQDIFSSKQADECDALRGRITNLDTEADDLQGRIAAIEKEIAAAQAERTVPVTEYEESVRLSMCSVRTASHQSLSRPGGRDDDADSIRSRSPCGLGAPTCFPNIVPASPVGVDHRGSTGFEARASRVSSSIGQEADHEYSFDEDDLMSRTVSSNANYQMEMLSPLLQQRRTEARLREAAVCHENTVAHMQHEVQVLESRYRKQDVWLKHIDAEVLKAEMAKTRYGARNHSAELRMKSLGQDLAKAYREMNRLVTERLEIEGMAVHNDAIAAYLDNVRKVDLQHKDEYVENRIELSSLYGVCEKSRETRRRFEGVMKRVKEKEALVQEAVEHIQLVSTLNDQLQKLWMAIPTNLKDSVFNPDSLKDAQILKEQRAQDGRSRKSFAPPAGGSVNIVHHERPVTSMQTIQASATTISSAWKEYAAMLAEASSRSLDCYASQYNAGDGCEADFLSLFPADADESPRDASPMRTVVSVTSPQ